MDFVLANYISILKSSMKDVDANQDLLNLLIPGIANPANIKNKNGEAFAFDSASASKIMTRKENLPRKLVEHSQDRAVKDRIADHFEKSILIKVIEPKCHELVRSIQSMIEESDIAPDRKDFLAGLLETESLSAFLGYTFLEVVAQNNIAESSDATESEADSPLVNHRIPLHLEAPAEVDCSEERYVRALLDAYGEHEGLESLSIEELKRYPKHEEHLGRQRQDYYAAEAVRRGTRDIYTEDDPDQFEELKDEIYEGVIDKHELDYDDGLARLRSVLSQACNVQVTRCWLSRDTSWIGNSQRKGVCHFLVNENRLKGWVDSGE